MNDDEERAAVIAEHGRCVCPSDCCLEDDCGFCGHIDPYWMCPHDPENPECYVAGLSGDAAVSSDEVRRLRLACAADMVIIHNLATPLAAVEKLTREELDAPQAPVAWPSVMGVAWREGWAEGYTVACTTIRAALGAAVTPTPQAIPNECDHAHDICVYRFGDQEHCIERTKHLPHVYSTEDTTYHCNGRELHTGWSATPTPEAATEHEHRKAALSFRSDPTTSADYHCVSEGCDAIWRDSIHGAAWLTPTPMPGRCGSLHAHSPHTYTRTRDGHELGFACPGQPVTSTPEAATDEDECDDRMPSLAGWLAATYCTRRVGHRGPHRNGRTEWRSATELQRATEQQDTCACPQQPFCPHGDEIDGVAAPVDSSATATQADQPEQGQHDA